MTEKELMKFAIENSKSEDGLVVRVFRIFDIALLMGNKEIIQSLIIENEYADILWAGSYPNDVALKLNEISSTQPLKKIPVSEDGNNVKIIASVWPFSININLT